MYESLSKFIIAMLLCMQIVLSRYIYNIHRMYSILFTYRTSLIVEGNVKVQNNVSYASQSMSRHGTATCIESGRATAGEAGATHYSTLDLEYETIDTSTGRQQQTKGGKVKMRERYEFAEIHNDLSVTKDANYEVPKNLLTESYQDYSHLDHTVS